MWSKLKRYQKRAQAKNLKKTAQKRSQEREVIIKSIYASAYRAGVSDTLRKLNASELPQDTVAQSHSDKAAIHPLILIL